MKVKPNSRHKTFNLDEDVITLIDEGSNINGMNQGEFLEFLVNSWDEATNPIKKLKHVRSQKKILKTEISEMETQENQIMDNMEKIEEWRKAKQEKKPEIIENLVRIISRGDRTMAETVAKNQSIRLGIPAMQLIFEAMDQIKKQSL
ncbi:hypothetical protein LCGC14_2456290 [marine sediment metagenome]|uniref:Uncharacterized protein n=1 Tax=marine sediment metagenome TaxID=412755 RepID=A0A0F9DRS3_9ZZZZ